MYKCYTFYFNHRMAVKMNDAGIHFPVWGTCLGLQEMTTWPLNPRKNLLSNCSGTGGVSLPLNFTKQARHSKLYGKAPSNIIKILSKERITPNFHEYCLSMATYNENEALEQFYHVTSTNTDSKGLEFVSSFEAKNYPFFGIQWHPEKINFVHSPLITYSLHNSLHGVQVSQFCANFLVEEARKNKNAFKSIEEEGRFLFNSYSSSFKDMYEKYIFTDNEVPKFD